MVLCIIYSRWDFIWLNWINFNFNSSNSPGRWVVLCISNNCLWCRGRAIVVPYHHNDFEEEFDIKLPPILIILILDINTRQNPGKTVLPSLQCCPHKTAAPDILLRFCRPVNMLHRLKKRFFLPLYTDSLKKIYMILKTSSRQAQCCFQSVILSKMWKPGLGSSLGQWETWTFQFDGDTEGIGMLVYNWHCNGYDELVCYGHNIDFWALPLNQRWFHADSMATFKIHYCGRVFFLWRLLFLVTDPKFRSPSTLSSDNSRSKTPRPKNYHIFGNVWTWAFSWWYPGYVFQYQNLK